MLEKQDAEESVSREEAIDEFSCPFCKTPNNCMAKSLSPCWCFTEKIPSALQDMIPESARGLSCICLACIKAYHENPEQFLSPHKRPRNI